MAQRGFPFQHTRTLVAVTAREWPRTRLPKTVHVEGRVYLCRNGQVVPQRSRQQ